VTTVKSSLQPIDLLHGAERVVAAYVLDTDDGFALLDCGPSSCLPILRAGLAERGLELTDISHLLLTHIHLDHAGATGVLVREHPGLQVHVSEVGAPHVIDPAKLEASARRLYGDAFDRLWGELSPVPEQNVHPVSDRVLGLDCFPSPGHARHHVAYVHPDGTLYSGDSLGVRIAPAEFVLPPTPPPDIDLDAWWQTVAEMERRAPTRIAVTHFGVFEDVPQHLARFRETLHAWAERVAHGMDEATFVAAARADCAASDPNNVDLYERAAPYEHCFLGLERYWRKRRDAAAA
jgi:glyoxylase-like metal-dependent hydrolase (beta-lactamase superfamily II)